MAKNAQGEGARQKNIALVLIFFQILGFFVLFPSFIAIGAVLPRSPVAFESDPLRAMGLCGLPLLFVGAVAAAWWLWRRGKDWAAIGVSALPLVVFAAAVLFGGTGVL